MPSFAFDQVNVSSHGIGLVGDVVETLGADLDDYIVEDDCNADPLSARKFGEILRNQARLSLPIFGGEISSFFVPSIITEERMAYFRW